MSCFLDQKKEVVFILSRMMKLSKDYSHPSLNSANRRRRIVPVMTLQPLQLLLQLLLLLFVVDVAVSYSLPSYALSRTSTITTDRTAIRSQSERSSCRTVSLFAKSRARNKQADLVEKLARAKERSQQQQQQQTEEETSNESANEFERLLRATRGALPRKDLTPVFDDEQSFLPYIQAGKAKQQKVIPKNIKNTGTPPSHAKRKQMDEEKNTAERIHFEKLLRVDTNRVLDAIGAAELVPWVPPFVIDRLIVICDPRPNSASLRMAMQYLKGNREERTNAKIRIIGVTADAPQQAKGWWRRLSLHTDDKEAHEDDKNTIQLYADPDLQWMTSYDVVTTWSLALLVFDTDGVVLRCEPNVDPRQAMSMIVQTEEEK